MARLCALGLLSFLLLAGLVDADEASESLFELKIRPVLANDCLPCHGGKKISSGLKVDSREALIQGGDRGPAVMAGDPEGSLLIQAIRKTHDEVKMPPKRRLSEETIAAFAKWIADGAIWPEGSGKRRRLPAKASPPRGTGPSSGSERLSRRRIRPAGPAGPSIVSSRLDAARPVFDRCDARTKARSSAASRST